MTLYMRWLGLQQLLNSFTPTPHPPGGSSPGRTGPNSTGFCWDFEVPPKDNKNCIPRSSTETWLDRNPVRRNWLVININISLCCTLIFILFSLIPCTWLQFVNLNNNKWIYVCVFSCTHAMHARHTCMRSTRACVHTWRCASVLEIHRVTCKLRMAVLACVSLPVVTALVIKHCLLTDEYFVLKN